MTPVRSNAQKPYDPNLAKVRCQLNPQQLKTASFGANDYRNWSDGLQNLPPRLPLRCCGGCAVRAIHPKSASATAYGFWSESAALSAPVRACLRTKDSALNRACSVSFPPGVRECSRRVTRRVVSLDSFAGNNHSVMQADVEFGIARIATHVETRLVPRPDQQKSHFAVRARRVRGHVLALNRTQWILHFSRRFGRQKPGRWGWGIPLGGVLPARIQSVVGLDILWPGHERRRNGRRGGMPDG